MSGQYLASNRILRNTAMSDAENMFQPAQAAQKGPMVRLRSWFFTGLLVTAPVLLTIYMIVIFQTNVLLITNVKPKNRI